ncbi:epoxyqueuosine reductase [Anoxybacterium hadale]|uniref:Epoxyqueuosine reductase n=1 Tax=Anoxybacterium hadale TaxID=3408580 RepID=A0ACD1AB70_9FIRM|nr:epoxyqueuosine reductase [Clostridiales bacterium]
MKEKIRELVLSHGADLCCFANIDRFDKAPKGFHPRDIFSECLSVISFAVGLPKGLGKVEPRLVYGYYNEMSCPETDLIAFLSAKKIEQEFSCIAVPIPCNTPYEYWDRDNMEGRGLLSMKHIGIKAGLGSLGKNTLLMNEKLGNLLTLGAILTNLDLLSDPIPKSCCAPECRLCIEACPVDAIHSGSIDQKLCRVNTYGKTERGFDTVDCNRCRTVCPINESAIR